MPPPQELSEEEHEALSSLYENRPSPLAHEPVWDYLVSEGLVWIDRSVHPPQVHLTRHGREVAGGN